MAFTIIPEYTMNTIGGVCFFCLSSKKKNELLVDCEKVIDFEGGVVICESCVVNMNHVIGGLSAKRADNLQAKVTELSAALTLAQETISEQGAAINALRYLDTATAASVQ